MTRTLTLSAIAAAALLSACATTHTPPPALVTARDAVKVAESDARVLQNAPLELKKASDALRRADALNADGESLAEVESAAYVATRQAQTAVALASAKANEEAIKTAEVDRERARADARTVEAQRAMVRAEAARRVANTAQAEASSARDEASSAKAQASMAQQQALTARADAGDAQARAAVARMQADAARASASSAQMQAMTLQQQLDELQAKATDRGMLVTLGDVLFEFGRADVKPGAQGALRKLASYLQEHPDRQVLIEGFTDSVGSDAANLALSQRRAEAVARALADLGVTGNRIATRGYGEAYPVAQNTSDTNRALNRRVEVYISDSDRPVRARG
jgi:outer membrane protein OmpA-like peptidoglycan-associated protein